MNVDRLKQQNSRSMNNPLEQWFEQELPKVIDDEIQRYQTVNNVQIALDDTSLEETKKSIAEVFKSCFQ